MLRDGTALALVRPSKPLLLVITAHRRAAEPMHYVARWKWSPKHKRALCGEDCDGARTMALPFRMYVQAECRPCGNALDALFDASEKGRESA